MRTIVTAIAAIMAIMAITAVALSAGDESIGNEQKYNHTIIHLTPEPDSALVDSLARPLTETLVAAFENNSRDSLKAFFETWHGKSQPITPAELAKLPEKVRITYAVFDAFYDPRHIGKYGKSECGNDIYKGIKYAIIQSEIKYSGRYDPKDTLYVVGDFRPTTSKSKLRPLYLFPEYRVALLAFLDESRPREEVKRRRAFLEPFVRVASGCWTAWYPETHPLVSTVRIFDDPTSATVEYRVICEGGDAKMTLKKGRWKLEHANLFWIE